MQDLVKAFLIGMMFTIANAIGEVIHTLIWLTF